MKTVKAELGLNDKATEADVLESVKALKAENVSLKETNTSLAEEAIKAKASQVSPADKEVQEKMKAGLSHDQAVDAVKRQREHDTRLAATKKETPKEQK